MRQNKQKGFKAREAGIILAILIVLALIGWMYIISSKPTPAHMHKHTYKATTA